ncbi:cytochrome c3 family protein [Campylobacter sp. 2018MI35]|uniref:cytochrome c3 family protein n=1 Tax=Campylobacter sp. 2018MI34 TaxID=2800582 RepID=UPI001902D666|nr:cytochrome c3 family protein [Campylobacter sp. 2018MI34]MBK1991551.1 cytochrome c3 family protein [Campylobacter sp. 2018MI34]
MRLFLLTFFLITCMWSKNIAYSDEVVSLYLSQDDTKVIGRLLPTNSFEILKEQGNKVYIKIEGFVNPKSPSIIYYNDAQRIIVAAFSRNTKLNFNEKNISKDKWDRVSLEIWADKKEFFKSDKEMLIRAKDLFVNNCGICHTLHKEKEFNANAWPSIFRSMVDRTAIEKKDRWLVIEYLQKNSKDFKAN